MFLWHHFIFLLILPQLTLPSPYSLPLTNKSHHHFLYRHYHFLYHPHPSDMYKKLDLHYLIKIVIKELSIIRNYKLLFKEQFINEKSYSISKRPLRNIRYSGPLLFQNEIKIIEEQSKKNGYKKFIKNY